MHRYSAAHLPPSVTGCWSLVPFAMWPAFPTSDYYGTSVTAHRQQVASALPVLQTQAEGAGKLLPTFTVIRWWGWYPALLLQPRHVHNAVPHAASPTRLPNASPSWGAIGQGAPRTAAAQINQVWSR